MAQKDAHRVMSIGSNSSSLYRLRFGTVSGKEVDFVLDVWQRIGNISEFDRRQLKHVLAPTVRRLIGSVSTYFRQIR